MIIFTDLPYQTLLWYFNENQSKFSDIRVMDIERTIMDPNIPKLYGIYPRFEYISKNALINYTEPIFDVEYYQYLDGPGFLSMMTIAGSEYFNGNRLHVYLIERSEYRDSVIESLQKVLFSRYGISSVLIYSQMDLFYFDTDTSFSVQGLVQISTDLERAVNIDSKYIERIMA